MFAYGATPAEALPELGDGLKHFLFALPRRPYDFELKEMVQARSLCNSLGLGSVSKEHTDRRTLLIVRAGLH